MGVDAALSYSGLEMIFNLMDVLGFRFFLIDVMLLFYESFSSGD